MSRLGTHLRQRREAARRARTINQALAHVTSPAMRDEILAILARD